MDYYSLNNKFRTENVQHGFNSWIDYDRSLLTRRQFLFSDYHAGILANTLAVVLTLSGPRLWILLRAFIFWSFHIYSDWRKAAIPHNGSQSNEDNIRLHDLMEYNLGLTQNTHSELSAARAVLHNLFQRIQNSRLKLNRSQHRFRGFKNVGKLGQKTVDVLFPVFLTILLLGSFVAQSAGTVLSAGIFGGSIAVSSPPYCSELDPYIPPPDSYQKVCYSRSSDADGDSLECYQFANRTINYHVKVNNNEPCPIGEGLCDGDIFTYDTEDADARVLGINSPNTYRFRRRSTVLTLKMDEALTHALSLYFKERPLPGTIVDTIPPPPLPPALAAHCRNVEKSNRIMDPAMHYNFICPSDIFVLDDLNHHYYNSSDIGVHVQWTHFGGFSPLLEISDAAFGDSDGTWVHFPTISEREKTSPFSTLDSGKESSLVEILLTSALVSSFNMCVLFITYPGPDLPGGFRTLPKEFEKALATIQMKVFHISRGTNREGAEEKFIPKEFYGICKLVKFRALGWTNVSTWGFLGILALAMIVTLGSVKSKDNKLWLIIAIAKLVTLFFYTFRILKKAWILFSIIFRLVRHVFKH